MNNPLPIGTQVLVERKLGVRHVPTLIQATITATENCPLGHKRRGGMLDYMVVSSPGGEPWVCNSRKVQIAPTSAEQPTIQPSEAL